MIGLVAGEQFTAIEFRPIAASNFMDRASLHINKPIPDKFWGEWGFAFSMTDIWIYKRNEISFIEYPKPMKKALKFIANNLTDNTEA